MSARLARTASRLVVAVHRAQTAPVWRSDSIRHVRFLALRGLSTLRNAPPSILPGSPATVAEPASPTPSLLNAVPDLSSNFAAPTDFAASSAAENVDAGSEHVSHGTSPGNDALSSGLLEPLAGTVDAAADAVATADAATVAQAAETAAVAGFSLSETMLQPTMFLLHTMHDYSGLPWWLAIGAMTVAVRTAILPLSVSIMRNSARLAALQGEISDRRDEVMEMMRTGNQSEAREKQQALKKFLSSAGVGPAKVLMGPFVQFPIFLSFFVGIRKLAATDPSMASGGAAWFTDLTVADPTFALPILSAISLLSMTELGGDTGTKMTPQMKTTMRVFSVLSVPFTYWLPAGVFCYWLSNSVYTVLFSLAMRLKSVRAACGLNVDPATIPGTKAFERVNRDAILNPPISAEKLTAAAAAASYIKKIDPLNVDLSGNAKSVAQNVEGKPVLLKRRPRKKHAKSSA